MYLTTLLMLTVIVSVSYGYQAGAPPGTCEPMTPFHGGSAQTGASSYTITPSANTYACGDTISVTLSGATFKGFLCQARPDASTYSTVGSLTNIDGSITTANRCAGSAALTHTESGDKSSFQFSWTHSGTSTDNIYIVCTVVQAKLTYWENLSSSAITYNGTSAVCSGTVHTISCVLLLCICIALNMVTLYIQ